jgi:hypothetical protein
MKLFKNKKTGKMYVTLSEEKDCLVGFDGVPYTGSSDDVEEVSTTASAQDFRRLHIVEETFSAGCDKDWHLKDILYVPVDGKDVAFRVEHISDEKVYFVAVDAVGKSSMTNMNDYLDAYLAKMPESLVNIMCEIEHCADGNLVRRSKLTLLSRKNVKDDEFKYDLNGADDILFDGLQTEAECCKNLDGETMYYWLDTPTSSPYAGSSTHFVFVYTSGYPGNYSNATGTDAVVPCFSIRKQQKADCE